MPLSIQHQADSAGDKAVSLITNNGGTNVAAAHKGVNLATQNGDSVADLVVSLDGEAIATGATDDAAAAGAIFPLAGLYQALASVDEIDSGDVGRVRLSKRRVLLGGADWSWLELNASTPAPSGSDVVGISGAALIASDFNIRDATSRRYTFPVTAAGFRNTIFSLTLATFDTEVEVTISLSDASSAGYLTLASGITVPSGTSYILGFTSAAAGSTVGPTAGADPVAATNSIFYYPILGVCGYVMVLVNPTGTPTAGSVSLNIGRSS